MFKTCQVAWLSIAACLLAGHGAAQSPEEIARIEAALPPKAAVSPLRPRKVLVFTLTKGFKHDSIPYGEKALELLGTKTGAYETTVSQDIAVFSTQNLKPYDAVILCNTTGELFTETAQREALLQFVREGKGLVGIHAATDCCYEWGAYGDLIGGYFDGHPWNANDTVTIKIEDTTHPVMAAFPEPLFTVTDEIYQLKDPYSREKLNVLASVDVTKTDMKKPGVKRADNDFAVSWVRNYGQGRVFYCSLGHNKHIYWNPVILQHYLAGIQFALGDLEADASPDRPLDQAALERMLPGLVADAAQTTYSGTASGHPALELFVQRARAFPATRARAAAEIASQFSSLADQASTESIGTLQFFGQKLGEIGTTINVPVLAKLLAHRNEQVAEIARRALELIPGWAASSALLEQLAQSQGTARLGLINSLGERGDASVIPALTPLLTNGDVEIVDATAAALGKIPTVESARVLRDAAGEASSTSTRFLLTDAALRCCGALLERGARGPAGEIAGEVFRSPDTAESLRAAALILMIEANPPHNLEFAVQNLVEGKGAVQQASAGILASSSNPGVPVKLLRRLTSAPADAKPAILQMIAYRGDKMALSAVRSAAAGEEGPVRTAALAALGKLGGTGDVALLAETAATSKDQDVRQAARNSLATLRAADVHLALVAQLADLRTSKGLHAAAIRAELIKALAARHDRKAVPALLAVAGEGDTKPAVAIEAWKALTALATADEAKALLDLLTKTPRERVLQEAERAALASIRQIEDPKARPRLILEQLHAAPTPEAQAALVRLLGNFGGAEALQKIRALAAEPAQPAVMDAAIRALASFATSDALGDVRRIAQESENPVHQALAVRGYARLLALPSERSTSDTLAMVAEVLQLAKGIEDKRIVVSELGGLSVPGTLALLLPILDEADLREEVMAAMVKLAPAEAPFAPEDVQQVLESIQADATNEETRKLAQKQLDAMKKMAGYLTAWRVAGPFTPPAETPVPQMLDAPFAPEDAAADTRTTWTTVAAGTDEKNPELVDLGKALGGKSRVAYLRTRVWAAQQTTAVLELGSDDGLRVWVNGAVLYSAPVVRTYSAQSDKVELVLQPEWNYIMLKVTQGSGEWAVSARLADPQGQPLTGTRQNADQVEGSDAFVGAADTL